MPITNQHTKGLLEIPFKALFFQLPQQRKCRSFGFWITRLLLFTCVPHSGGCSYDVKYKRGDSWSIPQDAQSFTRFDANWCISEENQLLVNTCSIANLLTELRWSEKFKTSHFDSKRRKEVKTEGTKEEKKEIKTFSLGSLKSYSKHFVRADNFLIQPEKKRNQNLLSCKSLKRNTICCFIFERGEI